MRNTNKIIHDFSNSIFNAIGFVQDIQIILEKEEYINQTVLDYLDIILNDSVNAVNIIQQLNKK